VAIRMTWTALLTTSAGRFSPFGPLGMTIMEPPPLIRGLFLGSPIQIGLADLPALVIADGRPAERLARCAKICLRLPRRLGR
jgi:hypothetical protein